MRIFIDSNIVISAILFPDGKVAKVFSHLLENHTVIISSYTKEECKKVFENKFPFKKELLGIFFDGITFEEFKSPDTIDENKYPKVRDIKDLPVLVSAILSDTDILITGDKDFEDVKIDKPLIFTPSKYFELIAEKYGYI
ncbi:putative toxin-antitoxin system toxin component, PIN family [Treponema putidum]|uniref:Toxin-antitoxin system toxin component, PIN family n=1 Tax=Treponema putidum TaxID=221027 RepID=A0ABY5I0D3_9SPIR|nr:putative toxin-antitoxin system toxin component, PIN family [Treponema putidum]UTY29837.1 putative toxin-antitoxin system toxin component, PIN family [Treponema putidum]